MYLKSIFFLLPLILPVHSVPAPTPLQTPSPTPPPSFHPSLHKRQSLSDLLALASSAGIPLPTDPAALLSLYPLATSLAAYLPTAPVLSVLETAVPPGFLSQIVHDPSFAAGFEQALATGAPPGWFASLPSDVRGYLHTYSVGGLVTEVGAVESTVANGGGGGGGSAATVSDVLSSILADPSTLSHVVIGQSETSGSARFGPLESGTGGSTGDYFAQTTGVPTGSGSGTAAVLTSATQQTDSGSVTSGNTGFATSQTTGTAASKTSAAPSSSTSTAAAAHGTSFLFAEIMVAVGAVGAIAIL